MTRIDMTQIEKQKAYNEGKILQEDRQKTMAFKFLGMHFSSNKNRVKPYSFKSRWKVIYGNSIYTKLDFIISGQVHRIKKKKKHETRR